VECKEESRNASNQFRCSGRSGHLGGAAFSAGLCWVTGSLGINYLFERRSMRLFLINGGYHTLQFTLYGVVWGLWH
jgi:hypothetical protein